MSALFVHMITLATCCALAVGGGGSASASIPHSAGSLPNRGNFFESVFQSVSTPTSSDPRTTPGMLTLLLTILAVQLHNACADVAWSPLSTLSDSLEYQPLAHQRHVSVPEVLQVASQSSQQLRFQSTDNTAHAFARLRRQSSNICSHVTCV